MSEENVELAKALLPAPLDLTAAFASPEAIDAMRAHYEPFVQADFATIHDPRAVPMGIGTPKQGGTARGFDGFIALWRDFLSAWESWEVTPTDFVDVDEERVLVFMTFVGRSKTHGVDLSLDGANLMTMRDGKLARLEMFFNRESGVAAAGIAE
jgi:ketosteroid isomerase-like protein